MSAQELLATAKAMVAEGKGIIAIDESNGTCNKRFDKAGIEQTEEKRRAYRDMLLTTPNLSEFITGPILFDETIRQSTKDGTPFVKAIQDAGMIPGIKVDTGAKDLALHPGEKVTEGLDGLADRFAEYYEMGARFAKWRAVITIGDGIPSRACIEANAHALARYAALAQEAGIVPMIEPEVLINGDHTIERCYDVTEENLRAVFNQLSIQGVVLEHTILKTSMVIAGTEASKQSSPEEVGDATVDCLIKAVPAELQGIVFLSGGQSNEQSAANLNAINLKVKSGTSAPWPLTFSYARAIQNPAMDIWKGEDANVQAAQKAVYHRAKCNSAASLGQYNPEMEKELEAAMA